jgi:ribosomal protein S14
MLYLKNKNNKTRKNFSKNEKILKLNKFVFINLLNTPLLNHKNLVSSFLKQKNKNRTNIRFQSRLHNRCVQTNTSKSVLSSFKLSRRYLRNALSFGLIPGYKKAVW